MAFAINADIEHILSDKELSNVGMSASVKYLWKLRDCLFLRFDSIPIEVQS